MLKSSDFTDKVHQRLSRKRSYRVLIRKCDSANPDYINKIIAESFADLGIELAGKVLIKPNVVTANRQYIHHSYTDPTIVAQAINHCLALGADKVTVGESGGYGIPSRLFFKEAGYLGLKKYGAKVVDFNIEPGKTFELERGVHHTGMIVPNSLSQADFLLWMPKLKYHICCTITCALKLNVGILTHKERMLFHDDRLDEKIVDLLEFGYPDAVVTDAIKVGIGFESAPRAIHLGAIMVSDDPVAMDIAACRVLGYEPEDCTHLMLAIERGYGPKSIDDVKIDGDFTLSEAREITKDVESEYQDIQKVDTPIRFYCGTDPERGRFCHGGCLAAVKGCLGTIDKRRPGSVAKAKEGAIVTGVYKGDVDAGSGVAFLIGDCTKVEGKITAGKIKRIGGCPIGAKQLFFSLPFYFRLPSPLSDVKDSINFILYSIDKFFRKIFARLTP